MTGDRGPLVMKPDESGIFAAAAALRAGDIVALPTETVYGLAARADSDEAVARIYRAKGRPAFNPLIVHVLDIEQAATLGRIDDRAARLAKAFWPGPLTIIVPLREDASLADAVAAGLPTVALRSPAHPVMRGVLKKAGVPLAAPSANRSGSVSPTCAEHVIASLGTVPALIVDGGACPAGIESTIVALREGGGWQILRPGPVSAAQIADLIGPAQSAPSSGTIEAPGQLARHYAPGKPVRLNAVQAGPDEFHIGFAEIPGDECLSPAGDLAEAASRLYGALHKAAAAPKARIAVAPIPEREMGIAINDRLRRAAADADD